MCFTLKAYCDCIFLSSLVDAVGSVIVLVAVVVVVGGGAAASASLRTNVVLGGGGGSGGEAAARACSCAKRSGGNTAFNASGGTSCDNSFAACSGLIPATSC